MKISGVYSGFAKPGPQPAANPDARVRNTSGVSGLGDAAHRVSDDFDDLLPESDSVELSQNSTSDFSPTWHGPVLRPTFVAQVMGQVMMDHREQAVSLTRLAYANSGAARHAGALIDGRI